MWRVFLLGTCPTCLEFQKAPSQMVRADAAHHVLLAWAGRLATVCKGHSARCLQVSSKPPFDGVEGSGATSRDSCNTANPAQCACPADLGEFLSWEASELSARLLSGVLSTLSTVPTDLLTSVAVRLPSDLQMAASPPKHCRFHWTAGCTASIAPSSCAELAGFQMPTSIQIFKVFCTRCSEVSAAATPPSARCIFAGLQRQVFLLLF